MLESYIPAVGHVYVNTQAFSNEETIKKSGFFLFLDFLTYTSRNFPFNTHTPRLLNYFNFTKYDKQDNGVFLPVAVIWEEMLLPLLNACVPARNILFKG